MTQGGPAGEHEWLSGVVDRAREGIVTIDDAGRVVLVNAAAERLLDRSRAALLGRPVAEVLPALRLPTDAARAVEVELPPAGRRLRAEPARLDRATCWYLVDASAPDDLVASLAANEQRLWRLIENLPMGAVLLDGDEMLFNPRVEEVTGYNAAEIGTLDRWFTTLYGDDAPRVRAVYEADRRAAFPRPRIVTIRHRDGRPRQIEFFGHASGNTEVWLITDVTEREQAARALAEAHAGLAAREALLDLFFDATPLGIALYDAQLRYQRINERLAAINGRPVEAHIGRTLREVLPELDPAIERQLRQVLETGEAFRLEVASEAPAMPGVARDWAVSYFPVRDHAGGLVGVGTIVEDITERRRAEAALREREAQLAQAQEIARLGSWDWDLHHRTTWSAELFHLTGFDPARGA
ncbi:MAG TPA: PAS domain-containing protein, partial [Gemmatimonadaceae bacterium]|nr:PAS domain-containing protein [Gemmatimonadaceae bacterium]